MRIGVDAGGTFTDFVVLHEGGPLEMFKLRSNPADPALVILEGIRRAVRDGDATVEIRHGSTVATNALLERKGARTAFVASPGFRELLAIGRQNRRSLYSLHPEPRPNLVPAELSFEWTGDGAALLRALRDGEAESVAICLLRAYSESGPEESVERALAETPYVSRSSEVAPEFREYERASTTVLNAYVGPMMSRYLGRLETECPHAIRIMQSNGGLLDATEARRHAVRTILSGPAGGVIGAQAMADQAGFAQALTFDMGGTSTDVSLIEDPLLFATEAYVDGFPVRVPMLDIHTVGAGGGSLARVDAGGRLSVGPESAGAMPGPACYGNSGGATVTDAQALLGRIVPERFLDGSMQIDVAAAEAAFKPIARALGVSVIEAAQAVVRIANSNMQRAIRVVSVERGRDPREFALAAFGGAGGLHACEMAEEMGIDTILFPAFAGALSALGMLLADSVRDYAAGAMGATDYEAKFAALETAALKDLPGAKLDRYADIRYSGQSYELTVRWNAESARAPFEEAFARVYGSADPLRQIEVVTVRVRAIVPTDRAWLKFAPQRETSTPTAHRVFTGSRWEHIPGWERASVPAEVRGPALLFDYGSTIYVAPAWRLRNGVICARESGN